jgi:hypothetical protein
MQHNFLCGLLVKQKANGKKKKAICFLLFAFCCLLFALCLSRGRALRKTSKQARCFMRAIVALLIVVAMAFVFVGVSAAARGGDVKSSPLFKRSLEESIASLERKAPKAELAKGEAEATPTSTKGCDAPYTSWGNTCSETCEPTQCGGECYTQANTCFPTVCGGTCASTYCATCTGTCLGDPTCGSTCESTCANTCSGTSCSNYCVEGKVKRDGQYASWSGWVNRYVVQLPLMQRWTTFSDVDGAYFLADIGGASQTLRADAHQTSTGFDYRGWRTLWARSSPGTTHDFDINTTIVVEP